MHDGGGNRYHCLRLPQIIDGLRAKGHEFVSAAGAVAPDPRAADAAALAGRMALVCADAFIFEVFRWFRAGIAFIFVAGNFVGQRTRVLIIGVLALVEQTGWPAPGDHPEYKPRVTVLDSGIQRASRAIVDNRCERRSPALPCLEVPVVNDGSTDRTSDFSAREFQRRSQEVR